MRLTRFRDAQSFVIVAILTGTALILVPPSQAAPRFVLPPGLQQAAVLCLAEALRVCPDTLKAKDHGIACIRDKRHLLSVPCRTVYDQGASYLRGGDVHLDLRSLQRKPPARSVPAPGPESPGG